MGCRCCRMIKSYIYDPSVPVDVQGRKQHQQQQHQQQQRDPVGSTLYQPHPLPASGHLIHGSAAKTHEGFHNLGYSGGKLDRDNNHINQHLHGNGRGGGGGGVDPGLYILQPEMGSGREGATLARAPPIYHVSLLTTSAPVDRGERLRGDDVVDGSGRRCEEEEEDEDEDEGVASTAEYVGDTADEDSVLSGDIHTSSTSLSSADTKPGADDHRATDPTKTGADDRRADDPAKTGADDRRAADPAKTGADYLRVADRSSAQRAGWNKGEEEEECVSVTDSMVAEALAALEAATAGEDYE